MKEQVGARLEEERKRLGLTQDQMAGLGGVAKRTYCNYEAGERDPGASMLAALAKIGTDIQYIVTGIRSVQALTGEETMLLQGFRGMDEATKKRTLAFVLTGESNKGPKYTVDFGGAMIRQATAGNLINKKSK